MEAGVVMICTGGVLVISIIGVPEGSAVVVGGTEVLAIGAIATETGVVAAVGGTGLMMNAANNSAKGYERGNTKTDGIQDNGKNERHGDGGRTYSKTEKQRTELQKKINNASSKKERKDLENKLKHINQDAERKAKGEEHSRGRKR